MELFMETALFSHCNVTTKSKHSQQYNFDRNFPKWKMETMVRYLGQ